MAYKHNDECLKKVAPDEPIFVLRAQDRLAPMVVRYWAVLASQLANISAEKAQEAYELAGLMEQWQGRRNPD